MYKQLKLNNGRFCKLPKEAKYANNVLYKSKHCIFMITQ